MEKTVIIDPIAAYTMSFFKGKGISEYQASKECGFSHVYAKTVFERFVKHGLVNTRSETFMRLACEYYDSNVD